MTKDYFLSYKNFYKRLESEFLKYGELIIAVDFDDTIFNYHKRADRTYNQVIDLIKEWKDYAYIIVFTSRGDDRLNEVKSFLKRKNIPVDNINQNKPDTPFGNNCKIYYNVLLDDRAGLGWSYKALKKIIKRVKRYDDR